MQYLPDGTQGTTMPLNCVDGVSVEHVLRDIGIPAEKPVLAILNGDLIQADDYPQARLSDGDMLSVVPPIQAG